MKPDQRGLSIGIGLLLVAVFFLDTRMGLGFTPWLLYIIPLGLTYWTSHRYAPPIVAACCTILTIIGFHVSPPLVPEYIALTNRALGIIMFWALACLIIAYQMLVRRLSQITIDLRQELVERTQDLGRAVNALRATETQHARREASSPHTTEQFKREVADLLIAENRRLQEQAGQLEQPDPLAVSEETKLDDTRQELERLAKQLEQLQRDLLRPE